MIGYSWFRTVSSSREHITLINLRVPLAVINFLIN